VIFEEDPDFTDKALRMIGEDGIFAIQVYTDCQKILPKRGVIWV